MKLALMRALAAAFVLLAAPALAQGPKVRTPVSGNADLTSLSFGSLNGSATPVDANNPLPALAPRLAATTWPDGTQPQDMRAYASVEIQVSGLSGGDSIVVSRSLTSGGTYANQAYVDGTFNTGTTITADGTYSYTGFGLVKWTKTGTASSPTVVIRGSN